MTALSIDERAELAHLCATTRDGGTSYRTPKATPQRLVRYGFAVAGPQPDTYRITPAGVAALAGGAPSAVTAWCGVCGAVTVHHCLYDHATGERFECAGCAERIAS